MARTDTQTPVPTPQTDSFGRRRLGFWSPGIVLGLVQVVGRRLWSHLALMLAIAAGFIVTIALVVSIPVYAEAVGYRILREELSKSDTGIPRPPFSFMYRYLVSQGKPITQDDYTRLDTFMGQPLKGTLGLPVDQEIRYVASDRMPLMPSTGSGEPLTWINVAFASDFEQHIELIDGAMPSQAQAGAPMEVLISERMASEQGLQIGEEYLLLEPPGSKVKVHLPIRIAGVWREKDPADPYWFYDPYTMKETLFVSEQSFTTALIPQNPEAVYVALWYYLTDGSGIRSADVPATLGHIRRTVTEVGTVIPGVRLDVSPSEALTRHQIQVQRLTIVLTSFSIPILGLIAYFIVLVAGLVIQRQSSEIAVLRSRGASRPQILGIYLLEWLLLGAIALGVGLFLGRFTGMVMTWTRSFLELQPGEPLPIELTRDAWQRAWQALALLILACLLPAFSAARYTIVSYKSERARATRKPFWQRAYLDVLLLVPVYYGYTQLSQQGTLAIMGVGGAVGDPFGNPLLLLAPSLYIFALGLVATRFFPVLMEALAWIFSKAPGVASVTALRYLARSPGAYTGPVLLLILTLSLASFTSTMARTLDRHLYEQERYNSGGDMRVLDLGQNMQPAETPGMVLAPPTTETADKLAEARYLFLPVTDYLTVPGVQASTRVLVSKVQLVSGGASTNGQFVGVDRFDLANVAYWREDYGPESLGGLMNRLADDPAAVLVERGYAGSRGLRIGDRMTVRMNDLDSSVDVPFIVAGYINLFPTVYPKDGPFVVGNLDYAFDTQGGQYPYEVWMRVSPDTTQRPIMVGLAEMGLRVFEKGFSPDSIVVERKRPERQGFFGLLSVGFVASAFLTVLGFLFFSVLSFQRRFVELGMLRAIGLSSRQLAVLLAWEQALIIGIGMLGGTLIGITASRLFIPFLQVRRGDNPLIPPFIVELAWDQMRLIYIVFAAMLLLAVLLTMILLRRMKLFQAVKLGEAI